LTHDHINTLLNVYVEKIFILPFSLATYDLAGLSLPNMMCFVPKTLVNNYKNNQYKAILQLLIVIAHEFCHLKRNGWSFDNGKIILFSSPRKNIGENEDGKINEEVKKNGNEEQDFNPLYRDPLIDSGDFWEMIIIGTNIDDSHSSIVYNEIWKRKPWLYSEQRKIITQMNCEEKNPEVVASAYKSFAGKMSSGFSQNRCWYPFKHIPAFDEEIIKERLQKSLNLVKQH